MARRYRAIEAADAAYLAARLAVEQGDPHAALDLITEAEVAFIRQGRRFDAARCDLGRMHALDDLGRHGEAIATGEQLLAAFADADDPAGRAVLADASMNLGNALSRQGNFNRALDHLSAARALIEDDDLAGRIRVGTNLADVLTELGRASEAMVELEAVWPLAVSAALDMDAACIARNAGEAACRLGRPDEGLAWFRRAIDLVGRDSADELGLAIDLADALARLGCLDEAADRFDTAARACDAKGLLPLAAKAHWGAGAAWVQLGARARAGAALTRAAELYDTTRNVPMGALVELERSTVASHEGDDDAVSRLDRLAARLDPSRWPIQTCLVRLRLGIALGASDAAESHLVVAHRLAERLPVVQLRYQTAAALGTWYHDRGRLRESESWLERALEASDAVRDRLHHELLARAFPAELSSTCAMLAVTRARQGDALGALRASEEVTRPTRRGAPAPADPVGGRIEMELDRCYDQLLGLAPVDDGSGISAVDDRVRHLEAELRRARTDDAVRSAGPSTRLGIDPVVGVLPPTLIVYQSARDEMVAIVHSAGTTTVRFLVASATDVMTATKRLHVAARRALLGAGTVRREQLLHSAVQVHLDDLSAMLLAPIDDLLLVDTGPTELVVVAHGAGAGVPFGALPFRRRELVDAFAVIAAPSVHHWADCRRRVRSPGHTVVAAVEDGGLMGVAREADLLAAGLDDVTVLSGGAASIEGLERSITSRTTCVHLAAHGLYRPFAPDRSGVRLADGWLTSARAARLPLDGATVVLSACDTGRSAARPGDEVAGLARGFFQAGASSVVASAWPADDHLTPVLMSALHRGMTQGHSPPSALRNAQLTVRDMWPEPAWWGGFFALGCGAAVVTDDELYPDLAGCITGQSPAHLDASSRRGG